MAYAPSFNGQFSMNVPKKNKKKVPKNAFSFYLDERVEELKLQGLNMHKSEAVPSAARKWKELDEDSKRKYKEMEKRWKMQNKIKPGKLDCRGERIIDHVDAVDVQEKNLNEQRRYLQQWYEPGKDICEQEFFLICFQSMYELPSDAGYLPCEVACVKFSLRNGILDTLHHFINPGSIKLGLRGECKLWREKTHRIPEDFEQVKFSNNKIWKDLVDFVSNHNGSNTDLVLFSKMSQLRRNKFCLKWLAKATGQQNSFRMFNLEDCVAEMFSKVTVGKPPLAVIEKGFESTYYDSDLNTRCEYHEEIECNACSLLDIQRCCFYIGTHLSKQYGIEAQRGKHIPDQRPPCFTIEHSKDTDFMSSTTGSVSSGWSTSKRVDQQQNVSYMSQGGGGTGQHFPFQSRDIRSRSSFYTESVASNDTNESNNYDHRSAVSANSKQSNNCWSSNNNHWFQDSPETGQASNPPLPQASNNGNAPDLLNQSTASSSRRNPIRPIGFPKADSLPSAAGGEPRRQISIGRGKAFMNYQQSQNAPKPSFSSLFSEN